MAVRTTAEDVKSIMVECSVSNSVINNLIIAANALIDEVFLYDTEVSDTILTEIEKWLTAHMLAVSLHRTTSEEKIGDASQRFTGKWGEGLKSTPYGQMVLTLDFTGKMGNVGKAGASIYAVTSFDEDE